MKHKRGHTDRASKAGLPCDKERFTAILAKASDILGSKQAAEEWLGKPALGLGGKRPRDLLVTKLGTDQVTVLLTRMEYGVYT